MQNAMLAAAGLGVRDLSKYASSGKLAGAFARAEEDAEGGESGPI